MIFELENVHVVGLDVYSNFFDRLIRTMQIQKKKKKRYKVKKIRFYSKTVGRVEKRVVVMLESEYFSFLFIVFCGLRSRIDYLFFFCTVNNAAIETWP